MEQQNVFTTIDHKEIREWVEKYAGEPELIDDLKVKSDPVGIRINFPKRENDEYLEKEGVTQKVDWDTFFKKFDELNLAFVYHKDVDSKSKPGDAYRFIRREV